MSFGFRMRKWKRIEHDESTKCKVHETRQYRCNSVKSLKWFKYRYWLSFSLYWLLWPVTIIGFNSYLWRKKLLIDEKQDLWKRSHIRERHIHQEILFFLLCFPNLLPYYSIFWQLIHLRIRPNNSIPELFNNINDG